MLQSRMTCRRVEEPREYECTLIMYEANQKPDGKLWVRLQA